jgi:hypothetical protein
MSADLHPRDSFDRYRATRSTATARKDLTRPSGDDRPATLTSVSASSTNTHRYPLEVG